MNNMLTRNMPMSNKEQMIHIWKQKFKNITYSQNIELFHSYIIVKKHGIQSYKSYKHAMFYIYKFIKKLNTHLGKNIVSQISL